MSNPFPAGPLNFALIGAAGFVAPRHMQAIRDTGHRLVAAVDSHDSVGVLDQYFPDAHFFTEIERFDRHLEKLRRGPNRVHCLSICSPNYLHDAHVRLAFRLKANALCEKPLVIKPWNLDQLAALEQEHGQRVFSVLQLRLNPKLIALRERFAAGQTRAEVSLSYITRRGRWYDASWKGSPAHSGGVAMNIGVHFFDLLTWIFGRVESQEVHLAGARRMAGALRLARAHVRWFLSVDAADLPPAAAGQQAFRSLDVDGEEIDLSEDFKSAHTRVYEEMIAGRGAGIEDVRASIELVNAINTSQVVSGSPRRHHLLR